MGNTPGSQLLQSYQKQNLLTTSSNVRSIEMVFGHYDADCKGYLDLEEGKNFVRDLLSAYNLEDTIYEACPKTVCLSPTTSLFSLVSLLSLDLPPRSFHLPGNVSPSFTPPVVTLPRE